MDVYAELTQTVWKPDEASERSLQLFGGAYFGVAGQPVVDKYFTAGLIETGTFASRPHDQIDLLGVLSEFDPSVTAAVGDRLLAATGVRKSFPRITEGVEFNYLAALAPGVTFRPFADLIFDPDQEFQAVPNPANRFSLGVGAQIAINLDGAFGFSAIKPVR